MGGGLPSGKEDYPRLFAVRRFEGDVVATLCNVCKKPKTKNKYNQTTVWSQVPCISLYAMTVFVVRAKPTTQSCVKAAINVST